VDICVEVSQVVVPQALTPYSESADNSDVRAIKHSDVRAADLQEKMAEQRFSVPSASTKTAATQRTSQRAQRAIKHGEFLLRASGLSTDARRAAGYE
jgi:predicted ABC-class ATPase